MPRIVYSLQLDIEREPGGPITQFIAPLDRQGNSPEFRPLGKPRVVDLRPGDWFLHRRTKKRYRIGAMSAYRQNHLSDEAAERRMATAGDGYIVPG